ncbi:MAG: ABC transporter permease [Defluviitoga tunisiensis]|jgi:peptide/nickel transport system permease protein|nr:ABC transporter permease [Defluviitoga tunisiensis]HOB16915.1 ABC transporter permease [Defluviitoga sp.]HOK16892.1 ABC transporter permease [Defluviitoga tunisiensis]HOL86169.1 ABC transporter permease [Defluviitoga tunisiensis]HPP09827.1 ABC transporter permease [Defluviitoga tunisiensis]
MFIILKDLLKRDKKFLFGFVVICILAFLAILSFFSPYNPRSWNVVPKDRPPSLKYLLGTNSMGQDIFWNTTYALRNSFILGLTTAFVANIIGTIVGLIAGYKGGALDKVLMSINDSFIVLPSLPILIFLSFSLRDKMNMFTMGLIISMFSWPWAGKQVRAQVLSLRERDFTHTAVFSGMNMWRVVFKEHLPFVIPWVIANFINTILSALGMEISLSVLGLSSLEIPTIGTTIYWAMQYQAIFRGIWWWILTPIILSVLFFVALYMLSVSISEFLDPRTRLQRIKMGG